MSPDAGTNVVDVYVNYLRRKLGVAGVGEDAGCVLIETVRGEGYQMGGSQKKTVARVGIYSINAVLAEA
jgi:DNA-binding response OmpR family regulator